MDTQHITTLKTDKLKWINIEYPHTREIEYLAREFDFHPLDLRDAYITKKAQRPLVSDRGKYLFLIFLFPVYNKITRKVEPGEVDFFIGKDYIITLHDNKLFALTDFFQNCNDSRYYRELYMNKNPAYLLYHILDRLFNNCFPMLDHIAENNQTIEENIFKGEERDMVKEILILKRNIVNFRTIMQSHRTIVKRLLDKDSKILPAAEYKPYYEKLLTRSKDIWEILENHKETIDALHQTNESSISFKLNDVMKTLTIISIIFLPLTLIASVFGMNNRFMPFVNDPAGFLIIITIMIILSILMIIFFKFKKWL